MWTFALQEAHEGEARHFQLSFTTRPHPGGKIWKVLFFWGGGSRPLLGREGPRLQTRGGPSKLCTEARPSPVLGRAGRIDRANVPHSTRDLEGELEIMRKWNSCCACVLTGVPAHLTDPPPVFHKSTLPDVWEGRPRPTRCWGASALCCPGREAPRGWGRTRG